MNNSGVRKKKNSRQSCDGFNKQPGVEGWKTSCGPHCALHCRPPRQVQPFIERVQGEPTTLRGFGYVSEKNKAQRGDLPGKVALTEFCKSEPPERCLSDDGQVTGPIGHGKRRPTFRTLCKYQTWEEKKNLNLSKHRSFKGQWKENVKPFISMDRLLSLFDLPD